MNPVDLYQHIAETYQAQGKYQERDRFLVLALDSAQSSGQSNLADQIRQRLLELNPNHLIKPYPTVAAALQSPNFITYITQLRKNFPPAKAKLHLQELGVSLPAPPKRTMLADDAYPSAVPTEDPKTPAWSRMQVETKPKTMVGPSIGIFNVADEPKVASDPLANVPVTATAPVPFAGAPETRRKPAPAARPEIIAAPKQTAHVELESPAGRWVGSLLFLLLFLLGVGLLLYVFVLPFYPDVAKMLKPGS